MARNDELLRRLTENGNGEAADAAPERTPETAAAAPEHDPEVVAAAMREGVPVAQMEEQRSMDAMPGAGGAGSAVDPVFTRRINVMDEYRRAYDEAVAGRQNTGAVTADTVREALDTLSKYKAGKANLESRIVENEDFFRLMHWTAERKRYAAKVGAQYNRSTAWLFSAIANKVADFIDNFPDATVLPREQNDERAAKQLTALVPVILEKNRFKSTYRHVTTDKTKHGCGIFLVVWDPELENGLGDVAIRRVDPLNIFWEPGVEDIQQSANVFTVELRRNDDIIAQYPEIPELKDHLSTPGISISRYIYNDSIDTSDKSYVVNWYYKRRSGNKTVLHYCRFVNDVVLFASENDPRYAEGWYRHGRYPFEFDVMYPDVGTPFGFGEIDIGRDAQEDLDEMNAAIMRNTKQALRRRYLSSMGGKINEEEFADLSKDIVHVQGNVDEMSIREITVQPISEAYLSIFNAKVNELKETTANRDVTQGGTGGTSTASGIAALQESGNKVSRDLISASYESFRRVCELVIELVRQFYDVPRTIRVTGENGAAEYMMIDNSAMQSRELPGQFGIDAYRTAEPVFDVTVKAHKQNPWSRQQQNQDSINMYNMGFFAPDNYVPALACLEMMDIDNKDKLKQVIAGNGEAWIQAQMMAAQQAMAAARAGAAVPAPGNENQNQPKNERKSGAAQQQPSGGGVVEKARAQAQAGTAPRA